MSLEDAQINDYVLREKKYTKDLININKDINKQQNNQEKTFPFKKKNRNNN